MNLKFISYRLNRRVKIIASAVTLTVLWLIYQQTALPPAAITSADIVQEIAGLTFDAPLELITQPQDGVGALRELIQNATQSINLSIYQLTDADITSDLVSAKNRGVVVRVILNKKAPFSRKNVNEDTYSYLNSEGVGVKWSPSYFPYFHQKTLVVDHTQALIMTFNLTPKYYASGRDFGILNKNINDVIAIEEAFENDWNQNQFFAQHGDDLVWSPGSAETLLSIIDGAQKTLDVYNEEMADNRITQALKNAAGRDVDVRVVMTYSTSWKKAFTELVNAGVHVHTFPSTGKLYIHAKMILADEKTAFLGSENFSYTSLNANRELGILIANPDIISSLENTFTRDFNASRTFISK